MRTYLPVMNPELLTYSAGFPLLFLTVTSVLKYPFGEKAETRQDALKDFVSDIGVSFYLACLSVLITTLIAWHGANVSNMEMALILVFGVFTSIVGRLYTLERTDRKNEKINVCFLTSLVLGLIPLTYSLYVLIVMM
jgi:heme/copper-type cytochrome/quinol oxidase subunit 4